MLIRDNVCSLIISNFNTQSYITSCTYSERRQITRLFLWTFCSMLLINLSYYPSKIATSEKIKYKLFSFVIKYKNSTGIMAITEGRWVKDVSYHVLPPTDFLSRVCWWMLASLCLQIQTCEFIYHDFRLWTDLFYCMSFLSHHYLEGSGKLSESRLSAEQRLLSSLWRHGLNLLEILQWHHNDKDFNYV